MHLIWLGLVLELRVHYSSFVLYVLCNVFQKPNIGNDIAVLLFNLWMICSEVCMCGVLMVLVVCFNKLLECKTNM